MDSEHLFHPEKLNTVFATLATTDELGIAFSDLQLIYKSIGPELNDTQKELLRRLNLSAVKGLPLVTAEERILYERTYALALGKKDTEGAINGVSYPMSGRATSLAEGWIAGDQVFTDHLIKGLGKTKAMTALHHTAYKPGYSQDATTDILGTILAREAGVLTPLMLPPLKYKTHIINGEEKNVMQNKLFGIHRCWSSDVRINNLYKATHEYLSDFDIEKMVKFGELADVIDMMRGRVTGFLEDAETINKFNKEHHTSYHLGCSRYLKENDYSYKSYSKAFQKQIVNNLTNMLKGGVWHGNLSAHNISIAGEFGDWDKMGYQRTQDSLIYEGETFIFSSMAIKRAELTLENIRLGYQIQGLILGVLGEGDFISIDDFWEKTKKGLPANHWCKNISLRQLHQIDLFGALREDTEGTIEPRLQYYRERTGGSIQKLIEPVKLHYRMMKRLSKM